MRYLDQHGNEHNCPAGPFPRLYTQREVSDMLLLQTMLNEDALTDRVLDPWTNLGPYRQIRVIRMLLEVERGQ